jgi:hypothetical protein
LAPEDYERVHHVGNSNKYRSVSQQADSRNIKSTLAYKSEEEQLTHVK